MRLRPLLVPTALVLAVAACRSTDDPEEETPTTPFAETFEAPEEDPELFDEAVEDPFADDGGDDLVAQAEQDEEGAIDDEIGGFEDVASQGEPDEEPVEDEVALEDFQDQEPLDLESLTREEAERQERLRQRQALLAEQFVEQGDAQRERGDLRAALESYAEALQVMPSNQEARQKLRQTEALLGDPFAGVQDVAEEAVRAEAVRREMARLQAEEYLTEGDNAMRAQRYDDAIDAYRRALNVLRFRPLIATAQLDEALVQARLDSAVRAAEEQEAREQAQARSEAEALRAQREAEERDYRVNKLTTLYAEANAAFQREDYALAESLAKQILLWDPGNEYALEMANIASSARHQKADAQNRRLLRENWIRTFEDIEGAAIPQQDSILFDDLDRWREVSQRRPLEFARTDPLEDQDKQAILERLETVRIRPRFGEDGEGVSLDELATFLQRVTGVNFVISTRVREDLDEEDTTVYLDLPERSVRKVLDIIVDTSPSGELRWKVEDGVVKFVTTEEMVGGQVLAMYEVRDLVHPVKDFPGREINVEPSGGLEPFDEDFDEREALVLTEDSLDALIRDNVAPESWDLDPRNSLRISGGTLVVYQTPEVQDQIQRLLEDLREATGIMVDVQARFLKVEDNFLEDIGVDFRGLGSPGQGTNAFFDDFGNATAQQDLGDEIGLGNDPGAFLDEGEDGEILARIENLYDTDLGDEDVLTGSGGLSFQWTYLNDLQLEMVLRAVSKSERVELVTAPRLLVSNTARSNLTVLNQVAYVQDYDVEIAQAASIADPVINVVEDGVILDVRPVVSADRRFITLELRPTVAELRRPIRTITTSLGNTGNSVTIQLPELEISRARTSVPIPDGGTVLLGGFKIHEQQDLRSGVPVLNKIPLLSFFFDRKGNFVSNRKLLILLKASIVIPEEHEPTPAQLGIDERMLPAPR